MRPAVCSRPPLRTALLVGVSLCLLAPACKKGSVQRPDVTPAARAPDLAPRPDTLNPACRTVGRQTVSLTTDDGVTLEADFYRTPEPGGPVALLLHMIPPHHDRTNYSPRFIDALLLRGINVLNLDRRGAGKSKGEPKEAYRGPKGWLDAKAAHDFLSGYACPIEVSRLACVGASNGTTTCLDFAVQATKDNKVAAPRALVLLTGGGYTEAQHRFADHRATLGSLPIMFVYSTAEGAWSLQHKNKAPDSWQFAEYKGLTKGQGHGTRVFKARPKSIDAVAGFIKGALMK